MTAPTESRSAKRTSAASEITTPPPGATVPAVDPAAGQEYELSDEVLGNECFGCGPHVEHGLQMKRIGRGGTTAYGEIVVKREHQGAPGLAHGGILATAMDEILGTSAWLTGGRYVTGRLETDYLAPVPVGSTLYLKAWCNGVEGRKAYIEGEGRIGGPDGPVAVRAAAIFVRVPMEHFTKQR